MTMDLAPGHDEETRLAALAVLAQQVRELMDAVVLTEADEDEVTSVTAQLVALTERLNDARRERPLMPDFAPDGAFRHLGNAVTGACNPHALPLVIEHTPEGSQADLEFRPTHEGPPNSVHGGVSAMILDHLLGHAVATSGRAGMTGTLTIRYRQPVPYGRPVVGTAATTRAEGRKTWADGTISLPDGTPLVEATGLFITPSLWVEAASD
ncbi:PaaI family thioesterase [Microtetraspora sp. AC03309]|uniref:PaaI family thioesterase n=1 Tax=Microtetraspora sp. AC03309 TaxID=2779376 RepID=UPI001E38D893|nr:PaaI family thioesterase [Microtetraspora sp. AC03309]MCC5578686.1 PaaI family thioesterase [Microtetraspora sp. AC03309]